MDSCYYLRIVRLLSSWECCQSNVSIAAICYRFRLILHKHTWKALKFQEPYACGKRYSDKVSDTIQTYIEIGKLKITKITYQLWRQILKNLYYRDNVRKWKTVTSKKKKINVTANI